MKVNNYLITTTELKTLGYTSLPGITPPADSLKMVSKQTATTYYDVPPTDTWVSLTPERVPKYQDFPISCYCYVTVENTLEGNPDPAPVQYEDCSGNTLFSSVPFGLTLVLNPCYYVSGDSGPTTGCGILPGSVIAPGCSITYSTRRDVPQVCTTTTTTTLPPINCYVVNGYVDGADLNASYNFEVCFDWYDCYGNMLTQCTISEGGFTLPYDCWNPDYGYEAYYYQYPGGPKVSACCSYLDAYNPCGTTTTTTSTTQYPIGNLPMIAVAVSKNTGQYQIAASGQYSANAVQVVTVQEGFIFVSNNYGVSGSWKKIDLYFGAARAWSEVAVSGNGQYMLAVAQNTPGTLTIPLAWKSNDYGVTWTSITTDPNFRLYGCAISGDGTYQTITGIDIRITYPQPDPYIIRSSNSGATFNYVTGSNITGLNSRAMFSVSMNSTGQYQVIASATQFINDPGGPLGYGGTIYISSNYGANWLSINESAITYPSGLPYTRFENRTYYYVKCSPDSYTMTIAAYLEDFLGTLTGWYVLYSTNRGVNWTVAGTTSDNGIFRVANTDVVVPLANIQNYTVYNNNYLKILTNFNTVTNWTAAGQKSWRALDMSNDRQIVTAVAGQGMFRSSNGGTTWTQVA